MTNTALVTGAASGIGRCLATQLVEDGYTVLINDIRVSRLDEVSEELGTRAIPFTGDLAKLETIDALVDKAFDRMKTVDLVFANAGISAAAPLLQATPKQFELNFAVNTRAPWLLAQKFAKRWISRGLGGRICITASEHSLGFQHAGNGLYTGSKQAILGIADVMRHELPENISLSVLCPGLVATGIYDHSHIDGVDAPSEKSRAFMENVMKRGMSPAVVARKAIAGTLNGDFLIVTHAVAKEGAERRWQEIDQAFETQAPRDDTSDRYRVTSVIEAVKKAHKSGQ